MSIPPKLPPTIIQAYEVQIPEPQPVVKVDETETKENTEIVLTEDQLAKVKEHLSELEMFFQKDKLED